MQCVESDQTCLLISSFLILNVALRTRNKDGNPSRAIIALDSLQLATVHLFPLALLVHSFFGKVSDVSRFLIRTARLEDR